MYMLHMTTFRFLFYLFGLLYHSIHTPYSLTKTKASPVLVGGMGYVSETERCCGFKDYRDIHLIESAQQHSRARCQCLNVGRQVSCDNIAVDIRYEKIHIADIGEHGSITQMLSLIHI